MQCLFQNRLVLGLAGLALVAATPLYAAPQSASERVYFGDLDLSTRSGETELQQRVNRAVWKVCRSTNSEMTSRLRCRRNTLAVAFPRVESLVYAARATELAARG